MPDIMEYTKKKEEQTIIETDTGKRKKEQYIENLREGDVVNDIYAIKIKNPPRPYKRGTWFGLVVTDKTGEINVKYWGGDNKERVKRLYDSFKAGDVVQVRLGNVEIYEEKPQISINETSGGLRRCSPTEYDVSDFIKSLDDDKIKDLMKVIKEDIKTIENSQLKSLLDLFFEDKEFVKMYMNSPSAMTHHHNYVGGNLEHTVGVIRLCKNISDMYPGINKDLVITGAILHDIGKLKEYVSKAAVEKTDEGNFIGHIVIGDRWIREKIDVLRKKGNSFDNELENKLCHIILSHHGKYEYGSPRMPKTIEAMTVHAADMMDSQVKNFIQNIEEGRKTSDDEWAFIWDSDAGMKRPMYLGEY
jgi:3'-5' exoribonuclease